MLRFSPAVTLSPSASCRCPFPKQSLSPSKAGTGARPDGCQLQLAAGSHFNPLLSRRTDPRRHTGARRLHLTMCVGFFSLHHRGPGFTPAAAVCLLLAMPCHRVHAYEPESDPYFTASCCKLPDGSPQLYVLLPIGTLRTVWGR